MSQPVAATSLAAAPNPSVFGQWDSFTATVSAVAPATGTTAVDGSFAVSALKQGLMVVEATDQDSSLRHVVSQSRTLADGSVTLGVVPFSPIAAVPVVPSPFVVEPPADANAASVESLYRAVLGRSGGRR